MCDDPECLQKPAIKQNHFLLCSRHIARGKERQKEFLKSLDQSLINDKTSFYFASAPIFASYPDPKAATPNDLIEPDVNDPPIYILQNIELGDGKKLFTFFDSGCFSAGFSDRAFSVLNAEEVRPGPTILDLAAGVQKKIPYGDYRIYLPLEEKVNGAHKLGTFTALRLPEVSSVFPLWPLQEAWDEISAAYLAAHPAGPPLPQREDRIGGDYVDVMLGIRYIKYFPRLLFSLPSGLGVYRTVLRSVGGKSGVLGGPHPAWRQALHCSHLLTARMYLSMEMQAFTSQNVALRSVMALPQPSAAVDPDCTTDFDRGPGPGCAGCFDALGEIEAELPLARIFNKTGRQLKEFQFLDNVGAEIEYRCPRCRNCNPCKDGERIEKISLVEEAEQHLIESCVSLDVENRVVIAKLPFIQDPAEKLRPNRRIAEKVFQTQMRLIKRNPEMREDVMKSHEKLAAKGHVVAVKDLPPDLQKSTLEGGYFIPWRTVYNVSSLSTPCRMVFDASSRTPGGESLNDVLAKGQNKLAGLFQLIIKFRAGVAAFTADISMAYNAVKLDPKHYTYQKYLWSTEMDESTEPDVMAVRTLIYGVKSAGNLTMAGFSVVAEIAVTVEPELEPGATTLKKNTYMDDVLKAALSCSERDLASDCLVRTLDYGTMTVKAITKSGEDPVEKVSADGVTVGLVGYLWYVKEDLIGLDIKQMAFGKAKRGKPPPPVVGDVREALEPCFTRRIIVGQVAGVFDPLGLIVPLTARLKLDVSAACKESADWDAPLPDKFLDTWVNNLTDIQKMTALRVPRNTLGPLTYGETCELLVCCDASEVVAVAAVYARVAVASGYSCHLVTAKSKLVTRSTVPRAELKAVTMGASLGHVVKECFGELVGRVTYVTDSAIALAWINQDQRPLKCGIRNAVIEVRRLSEVGDWRHVESENNPADIGTRSISADDLLQCDAWFTGMDWMKGAREDMPLKKAADVTLSKEDKVEVKKEVRSQEHRGIILASAADKITERYAFTEYLIDPCRLPWPKIVRVAALCKRVCGIWSKKAAKFDRDPNGRPLLVFSAEEITAAEDYFFTLGTAEVKRFSPKKVIEEDSVEVGGILRYKSRILDGTTPTNVSKVMLDLNPLTFCRPIVDRHSPIAASIMIHAHQDLTHHGGAYSTLRKSREIAFIIDGRSLAVEVCKRCPHCRRYKARLLEAEMGPVHESRLIVAPAFYSCQVDLMGPFTAMCEHNHRAVVKVWGAVFKCTATGALSVECMAKYDAASFLHAYSRFANRYGHPALLHMDEGSQIKKACLSMEISMLDIAHSLNSKHGVKLDVTFSPVGGHNSTGMVERSIREIRKIFEAVFSGLKLDILSYQTAFSYIANEINNMPLCLGPCYDNLENLDLITPSRLILGRNNTRAPVGINTFSGKHSRLLQQMDEVEAAWWRVWEKEKLVTLVPRARKWKGGSPDIRVSDIVVFLRDGSKASIGETAWRVGRVVEVEVSKDGVARTAVIEYRNAEEAVFRRTRRSVRSVALLEREEDLDFRGELSAAAKSANIMFLKSGKVM